MIPLRAGEIADLVGGRLHHVDSDLLVTGAASVDSRSVEAGGLFVAIAGERVDGTDFAEGAVTAGAALALTAREIDAPCVVVPDPVRASGYVAAEVARRSSARVCAITGSQGKTSTKDLLRQILERNGETVATEGNLNNEIGVPLTITRATERTRHLVVEMGARHIGNIAYLCGIAPPEVGVVVNVGVAHIGEFGSREGIARAKGELVEALPADGSAVLNADDPFVRAMSGRTPARAVLFGESERADVRLLDPTVNSEGEPTFALEYDGERADVHLRMLGMHQAVNAAAAATAALALDVSFSDVVDALNAATVSSAARLERHELANGVALINDAYNANPDSMRAALATLRTLADSREGRSIAVLGEMRELGTTAAEEHRQLGAYAAESGLDELVLVGDGAAPIAEGWTGAPVRRAADADAAVRIVEDLVGPGDVVLVKASLTIGLQRVARELVSRAGHTASSPGANGSQGADERTSA
ncbi:UDP-N-acetylmuramoyl-tripeptide--D-alanyl-D-alanine ligase [Solicola gregarius]|uniref:UDP-N-acetylmuramoyl-tripeptide--D-alanyl-D-alanine ligase n=1 Tax=Solicola gregarius TaxID=2908642 RepID=A0AA46TIB5_9ACTN|nr:UDP-N-acetylmuramoyl-tripeptide--D-alanyl-D-alanine ligase [Solicola gregarius]UYM05357.1 UDP-N-acetylmuramoyl-tripeptide--D-alanyl-D-alanine ligase [Solicola gregarius]